MATSFCASPLIGATTTLACFAHEIPHEIADYPILIRSGFNKQQAMRSQFLTAIGASSTYGQRCLPKIRTFIGTGIHNATASGATSESTNLVDGVRQDGGGLLGTTAQWSDLVKCLVGELFINHSPVSQVIPFVAGGFLYIGAVAVLPT
ncbi:hypothetical protein C0993_001760, partial [Termitomyces sp. T159_Od127]